MLKLLLRFQTLITLSPSLHIPKPSLSIQPPMKKKKQQQTGPPPTTNADAAAQTLARPTPDLKSLIHNHALFFDKLVELIPATFYISNDDNDSKPWFQGLSKAAKASAKRQTRENIKKARRDRLDPEKAQTTTLDILKQNIEKEKAKNSGSDDDDDSDDDEDEEIIIKPITDLDGEGHENAINKMINANSVTYEELQQRLHWKLEALKGNRGHGKHAMLIQERMNERGEVPDRKRKMNNDFGNNKVTGRRDRDEKFGKSEGDVEKEVTEATKGIAFGKVKLGDDSEVFGAKKKMRKGSKAIELERAKKLKEAMKDPEKGEVVAKKHSWHAATSRAMGVKVHDDPKLLKESIKKEKKRHEKNAGKWKERVESREKLKNEKQKKRAGNIAERIQDKKMRKIAKREKKLMRPGFEGRKEGYIGGD